MRSEKELFTLAKDMVFIEDRLRDNYNEMEREELTEEAAKIRNTLLQKNYDVNTFLHYKDLYKSMTIAEYYEFIKTLEKEWLYENRYNLCQRA